MVSVTPRSNSGVAKFSAGEALEARRLSKNLPFILGSFVFILIVGYFNYTQESNDSNSTVISPSNSLAYNTRDLPQYIYQFDVVSQELEELNRQVHGGGTRKIPYIWNQVWRNAGWTPVQLQVGKYEAEPAYQSIVSLLSAVSEFQRRHVYKYLAMAAVGGGYVAHTDTFPLQPFGTQSLPNQGRLTLYSASFPCLMSGNSTEWLRMAHRMAEHARVYAIHHPDTEWTEALALHQMQMDYVLQDGQVFDVPNVATDNSVQWAWNSGDCQATQFKRGVHFRIGAGEDLARMADPGSMIIKWINMWLQSCEQTNYFIEMDEQESQKEENNNNNNNNNNLVQPTGTYHAPENYNETRAQEAEAAAAAAESNFGSGGDEILQVFEETKPEQPPVQMGTYHAPTNYTPGAITAQEEVVVVDASEQQQQQQQQQPQQQGVDGNRQRRNQEGSVPIDRPARRNTLRGMILSVHA